MNDRMFRFFFNARSFCMVPPLPIPDSTFDCSASYGFHVTFKKLEMESEKKSVVSDVEELAINIISCVGIIMANKQLQPSCLWRICFYLCPKGRRMHVHFGRGRK